MAGNKLHLCTWNIRGINDPIKRWRIVSWLKKRTNSHCTFFIHLFFTGNPFQWHRTSSAPARGVWVWVFSSSQASRSGGVAVLVRRNLPFLITECVEDWRDFNGLMNPLIDSFPHRVMPLSPQAQSLKSGCEELRFVGVWRTIHPIDEDETVFSSTTHTSH